MKTIVAIVVMLFTIRGHAKIRLFLGTSSRVKKKTSGTDEIHLANGVRCRPADTSRFSLHDSNVNINETQSRF